jgi:hypothetical protein
MVLADGLETQSVTVPPGPGDVDLTLMLKRLPEAVPPE